MSVPQMQYVYNITWTCLEMQFLIIRVQEYLEIIVRGLRVAGYQLLVESTWSEQHMELAYGAIQCSTKTGNTVDQYHCMMRVSPFIPSVDSPGASAVEPLPRLPDSAFETLWIRQHRLDQQIILEFSHVPCPGRFRPGVQLSWAFAYSLPSLFKFLHVLAVFDIEWISDLPVSMCHDFRKRQQGISVSLMYSHMEQ